MSDNTRHVKSTPKFDNKNQSLRLNIGNMGFGNQKIIDSFRNKINQNRNQNKSEMKSYEPKVNILNFDLMKTEESTSPPLK